MIIPIHLWETTYDHSRAVSHPITRSGHNPFSLFSSWWMYSPLII
jgi:hypothetical protein